MNIVVVTYVRAVAAVKPGGRGSLVRLLLSMVESAAAL